MIIPYITKYKCRNCDVWHRVTLTQWWEGKKKAYQFMMSHVASGATVDQALERWNKKASKKS